MPTYTNKQLGTGALTTTLTTTLYTVPASTTTIVTTMTFCNTNTTTARLVTLKGGGGTPRTWLAAHSLNAKETLALQLNPVLAAADTIQGGQDVGTDVEYFLSGVEVT